MSQPTMTADQAREENAYTLGVQAYVWGYPLQFNSVHTAEALKVGGISLNTFRKFTALKTAKDRFVVTPNNVTIDAYGNYDVTREPVVVHVPTLAEPRWYIVQLGDFYDEIFHNVGGTKGPQPGDYVITGPDFSGAVPGEMVPLPSRTKLGIAAVRLFVNGEADLPKAVEAQRGFHLMPLSAYLREGLAYQLPEPVLPPPFQPAAPEELRGFELLGHAMQEYLPVGADLADPLVAGLQQIGLSVGRGFAWQGLDAPTRRGLARAALVAEQIIDDRWQATGETTNGWRYTMATGRAGYDWALRAALCKNEVGAQLAEQVIYPNTRVDDQGEPLSGAHQYTLHFAKDGLPPVATFWNLAMYADDMLFVENDFGRYSIGSTTDGLKKNADGSLTLHIQHERPADTANWLPAPTGAFNLTMRFYGPQTPVLDGSYRLPAVKRV
jgi:hypothetical protein